MRQRLATIRFVPHVAALIALAIGCDTPGLTLMPDDSAAGGGDAGHEDPEPWEFVPRLAGSQYLGFPVDPMPPPSSGWTSPAECIPEGTNGFCTECWSWTDDGPWSLGRNQAGARFGSVAVADFNGDGYPDLAVGAPGEDRNSVTNSGVIYFYLGSERGFQPWQTLDPADLGIFSSAVQMGAALAAGDFNDDGKADLAFSFGAVLPAPLIGVAYGGGWGMVGATTYSLPYIDPGQSMASIRFGGALAVGDLDGDGRDDLAIGADEFPTNSLANAGAVFVLTWDTAGIELPGYRLQMTPHGTPAAQDRLGASLSVFPATSGADTLVVGAPGRGWVVEYIGTAAGNGPWSDATMPNFGTRVVAAQLDGDSSPEIIVSGTATDRMTIVGHATLTSLTSFDPNVPFAIHPIGVDDFDDDGYFDVVALSESFFDGDSYSILLYHGEPMGTPSNWAVLAGGNREFYDQLAISAVVEDVNGDGLPDIVAGAPAANNSSATGRVHVFRVDDGDDWANAPVPVQMVDPELGLACDICEVHPSWPDGTECDGDDFICVSGACVMRGCGDGYRQPAPGTTEWPREGCDDGNTLAGDACSSTCTPQRLAISSFPFEEASPGWRGPAIGEDASGELLFVYTQDVGEVRELRARRYSRYGVPSEEDVFVLATGFPVGWNLQPSVAGLSQGWLVAWTDPEVDGDGAGIATLSVGYYGPLGPIEIGNTDETHGSQREPRMFSFPGGYGWTWIDESGLEGPLGGSLAKVRAVTESDEVFIDSLTLSNADAIASEASFLVGEGALAIWTEASLGEPELTYVMGSAFGESGLGAPFSISEEPYAAQPTGIWGWDGEIVVAWVRRNPASDYLGDVVARTVDLSTNPPTLGSIQTVTAIDPRAELNPAVTSIPNGQLVAYEDGGHRRGVAFDTLGTATLAPEATSLASYLASGLQGDVTLHRTSRGIWFTWSDSSGFGDPDAYRSVLAFLLPVD